MKELLPNMFGLYLGCKVRLTNKKGDILTFKAVGKNYMEFEEFENTRFQFGGKLLLKPLSAMSEEDKREFENKFLKTKPTSENNHITLSICLDEHGRIKQFHDSIQIGFKDTTRMYETEFVRALKTYEICFLASKGYDIGIIPREYVEIQEVE